MPKYQLHGYITGVCKRKEKAQKEIGRGYGVGYEKEENNGKKTEGMGKQIEWRLIVEEANAHKGL